MIVSPNPKRTLGEFYCFFSCWTHKFSWWFELAGPALICLKSLDVDVLLPLLFTVNHPFAEYSFYFFQEIWNVDNVATAKRARTYPVPLHYLRDFHIIWSSKLCPMSWLASKESPWNWQELSTIDISMGMVSRNQGAAQTFPATSHTKKLPFFGDLSMTPLLPKVKRCAVVFQRWPPVAAMNSAPCASGGLEKKQRRFLLARPTKCPCQVWFCWQVSQKWCKCILL